MSKNGKDYGSLAIAVISIILQAAAWIWPNAPQEARVCVSITSVVLVLFSQGSGYESLKSRIRALVAFLVTNYPLLLASLLSGIVIIVAPTRLQFDLLASTNSIMVAILAASLAALVLKFSRKPSIRVVKGSSDDVFLVQDGIKRYIPDPLTHDFVTLDTYRQTERISDLELRFYPTGNPLPSISECRLVKGSGPSVYVVWEEHRKHIPDDQTREYFFAGKPIEEMNDADLEKIPRTGALRTVLAGIGPGASITIRGDVYWVKDQ